MIHTWFCICFWQTEPLCWAMEKNTSQTPVLPCYLVLSHYCTAFILYLSDWRLFRFNVAKIALGTLMYLTLYIKLLILSLMMTNVVTLTLSHHETLRWKREKGGANLQQQSKSQWSSDKVFWQNSSKVTLK